MILFNEMFSKKCFHLILVGQDFVELRHRGGSRGQIFSPLLPHRHLQRRARGDPQVLQRHHLVSQIHLYNDYTKKLNRLKMP